MSKKEKESKEKVVTELEERVSELEEKWKRAVADYQNLEKRVAKEQAEFAKFSNFILISKFLPVLDDLEEAVEKSGDEGFSKILKKFRGILEEEGLEEIKALGKEFDPEVMEGRRSPEAPSGAKGDAESVKVVEVVRKGYTLNGRLLRPARVRVE